MSRTGTRPVRSLLDPRHHDWTLWLLIAGILLNSLALFASMPFLTLYLSDISHLSPGVIGGVVGSIALMAAFGGFAGGLLSDRYGSTRLIQSGLVIYVTAFVLFTATTRLIEVIALIETLGIGRLLIEPSMKKLLSLASGDRHGSVFRLRYVTLCISATIGPLIGVALYTQDHSLLFTFPVVVFAIYLVLVTAKRSTLDELEARQEPAQPGLKPWRNALADRRLLRTIAAGCFLFLVFSQFESILPLFIKSQRGGKAADYFAILLAANAVLGIAMQASLRRLDRRVSQSRLALVGSCGFAIGLAMFGSLPLGLGFLYGGVVLWTIGESVLIPLPDMVIHQLAGDAARGSYFGLAELRYLGFFLGPLVGGTAMTAGSWLYFSALIVVSFGCWILLRPALCFGTPATPEREPAVTPAEAVEVVAKTSVLVKGEAS